MDHVNQPSTSKAMVLHKKNAKAPQPFDYVHYVYTCAEFKKCTDQHMLAHCDTCQRHFHLSCLDPPLTKMPRKTAVYGWECSSCAQSSSSEPEEGEGEEEMDDKASDELGPSATVRLRNKSKSSSIEPRAVRQRASAGRDQMRSQRLAEQFALDEALKCAEKQRRHPRRPALKKPTNDDNRRSHTQSLVNGSASNDGAPTLMSKRGRPSRHSMPTAMPQLLPQRSEGMGEGGKGRKRKFSGPPDSPTSVRSPPAILKHSLKRRFSGGQLKPALNGELT